MDGIMAMEGNGPRGGDPVKMNVLLLSTDPVALDAVACAIVDLNPLYVPTMKPGRDWCLGTYLAEEIEIVGDPVDTLKNRDFKVKRGSILDIAVSGILAFINNLIGQRPVIDPKRCNLCGDRNKAFRLLFSGKSGYFEILKQSKH